ncbi:MAG: acetate--CoA ligase [Candidatus Chisholmbacteria bacterium RIFCSPLOWO2_01_FULL_49_14]|uniref:acetate--CoA ligase n=1 Tax=Candidatus Chisholmbacteria bacterium RIFCSPLOWO2_01_FULL_49_14 TaxID=1797593 RepID=A0A1G1W1D8_9BACT|nr:MAG: acetate--CoA ligase [Candidatus Chisholmbacteria bacterium RIFCSPLOWO2_01_FULL_49_14]
MKVQIYKKTKDYFKKPPNLVDYEKTNRTFSWKDAQQEIEYVDGKLNAAYNAIDRNAVNFRKNKIALYWEGDEEKKLRFTFSDLAKLSSRFANLLHNFDVGIGDRVFFFLPRVPELYYGFLGAVKRGSIAGTMFSAFGPQAIEDRLGNSSAKLVVTNSELLPRVLKVLKNLPELTNILLVDSKLDRKEGHAHVLSLENELSKQSDQYEARLMDPEDPAFMLYTSGTTGKPKGVIHAHRSILHEHMSAKWVLDLREEDVYWCTADPGWVTGIAYEILGSWSNGASSVVYSGRFDPDIWYRIIQDYGVNVWYTAPTAIRMLAAAKGNPKEKYDFSSLRHLASVGEPLNPEPIRWGIKTFGLPFHDNWWQTETGGILIANYPALDIKLGSMGKPLPGITAGIVDDSGKELGPNQEGNLAIKPGWPSMMKTIWRRPNKYKSYFLKGWYISGDRAFTDKDGYFWFIGRADDVIKTGGERVGPFEVESALVEHPSIIEAGVIGKPDPLRGEIIKAFVTLKPGIKPTEKLKEEIQSFIKHHLAGHAYPREIEFKDNLPKTRSGKIMRRMLKAQELGLPIGDTSTLEKF